MAGIEGAHVEVFKDGVPYTDGYTDAAGRWSCHLAPGNYLIRISKAGYRTIEKTETIPTSAEVIVNLPIEYPVARSGIAVVTKGAIVNPQIKESVSVERNVASATVTISESVSVTWT